MLMLQTYQTMASRGIVNIKAGSYESIMSRVKSPSFRALSAVETKEKYENKITIIRHSAKSNRTSLNFKHGIYPQDLRIATSNKKIDIDREIISITCKLYKRNQDVLSLMACTPFISCDSLNNFYNNFGFITIIFFISFS